MLQSEQINNKRKKIKSKIDVQNLADTSLFITVFLGIWQLTLSIKNISNSIITITFDWWQDHF